MSQPTATPPPDLDYRRAETRARTSPRPRLSKNFYVGIASIATCAIGLVCRVEFMILLSFAALCCCTFIVPLVKMWRVSTAYRRMTEAQFDAEWFAQKKRSDEQLQLAIQIYSKVPLGIWRWTDAEPTLEGMTITRARGWIIFRPDGSGNFGRQSSAYSVESFFQWKADSPFHILVQLTSPPAPDWHPIEFGVEISGADDSSDLLLWFQSQNPLPTDLALFWPFLGQFTRSAE